MSLSNDFSMYKEAIELILAQNHVEIDLYSIIASVIIGRKQSSINTSKTPLSYLR